MIRLIDLISLAGITLADYKVHFATEGPSGSNPMDAFLDGKWKEWQEGQNRRHFGCAQIVSLIYLRADRWLFAGVYAVDGVKTLRSGPKPKYRYATTELSGLEHLVGRVVVQFNKNFRQSYPHGSSYGEKLMVVEVREERISVGEFPGYNGVLVSHQILRTVVREEIPTWRTALSNVAGVYVVVDTVTGKQYVGSAYGVGGFWQRWKAYSQTGHGGNKELVALLAKEGVEYASNFQFSILEVADLNASKERILAREVHWKNVLCSRKHGYN